MMNRKKPGIMIFTIITVGFWLVAHQAFAYSPKEIYQKAGPGVVFILASEGSKSGSVGTGSIIRKDGLVITNAHVFTRKGTARLKKDIFVFLKPKRVSGNHKKDLANKYRGRMLAYDINLDLALIKIVDTDYSLPTVKFADSENVVIGDKVYAIGHPEQGGLWSLTTGVISAYRRDYGGVYGKNLFQTDASINRGNSGGPLLNENGMMVGINSMIARKAADGLTITDVNYSIMTSVALEWLERKGYRFPVQRMIASNVSDESEPVKQKPEEAITPAPEEKKSVTTAPQDPVKTDPAPVGPRPEKKVVVLPEKTEDEPVKPEEKKDIEPVKPIKPGKGKILTKKRPYRMSKLLRDMQEMEDMMDDMRMKIRNYKKKKN